MRPSRLDGLAVVLGSATSNQVGATVGAHAFATVGVVAVRQFVARGRAARGAAVTLLAPGRLGATGLPYAAGAGVLSSLPYAGDLIALRRVPARSSGWS